MNLLRFLFFVLISIILCLTSSFAVTCYVDYQADISSSFKAHNQYITSTSNFNPTGEAYPTPNPTSNIGNVVRVTIFDPSLSSTDQKTSMRYFYNNQGYRPVSLGSRAGCNTQGGSTTTVLSSQSPSPSYYTLQSLYRTTSSFTHSDLSGNKCTISASSTPSIPNLEQGTGRSVTVDLTSSLLRFKHHNGQEAFIPEFIRKTNYDMSSGITVIIRDSSNTVRFSQSYDMVFAPSEDSKLNFSIPNSLPADTYSLYFSFDTTQEIKCGSSLGENSGEISLGGFTVTPPPEPQGCTLDGITLGDGQSREFYKFRTVTLPELCDPHKQTRICNDGSLTGDNIYQYGACIELTPPPPTECTLTFESDTTNTFSARAFYVSDNYLYLEEQHPQSSQDANLGKVTYTIREQYDDEREKIFLFYKDNLRVVAYKTNEGCQSLADRTVTIDSFGEYLPRDLTSSVCVVDSGVGPNAFNAEVDSGESLTFDFDLYTNLKTATTADGNPFYMNNFIKNHNYDPEVEVTVNLLDENGVFVRTIKQDDVVFSENADPEIIDVSTSNSLSPGDYQLQVVADPTLDSKCPSGSQPFERILGTLRVKAEPLPPQSCILDGKEVSHGNSSLFFKESSVPYGFSCDEKDQLRTCTDGTLSGNSHYQFANCYTEDPDVTLTALNSPYYNFVASITEFPLASEIFTILVEPGVTVGSNSPTQPALTIGPFPSGIEVILYNEGTIAGMGGSGGDSVYKDSGESGERGGTGIELLTPVKIENNNRIFGGGGAGGAGGAGRDCSIFGCWVEENIHTAGAGGGGQGIEPGQAGSLSSSDLNPSSPARDATATSPGTGGPGAGNAGNGGDGGNFGQRGQDGTSGNYRPGGQGGPAGFSILTNHNSLQFLGSQDDVRGPIVNSTSGSGQCTFLGNTLPLLDSLQFYKRPINTLQRSCNSFLMEARCGYGGLYFLNVSGSTFGSPPPHVFENCTDLPPGYHEGTKVTETNGNYTFEEDDGTSVGKVKVNPVSQEVIFVDQDGSEFTLDLPEKNTATRGVQVYRDGDFVREDRTDPKLLALKAHKIVNFKSKLQVENFITNTFNLMDKFDVRKDVEYTNATNRTRVTIQLSNIPQSNSSNFTVYKSIPKRLASHVDNISIISNGGGQLVVQDPDPVIGWYFNSSEGNETIEYEVEGEGEGGTIIITYEPILFNEGDLVVNYREDGCAEDEVALFELEDLEDSRVFEVGTGELYTVCITHLTEELFNDTSGFLDQHLFMADFASSGNLSYDNSLFSTSIDLSSDNTTKKYWDMRLQEENPNGYYSCLGSITNETTSLFGDCGYSADRIWLHFNEDTLPPVTTMDYPYIANSISVTLYALDNIGGSGVANTYYCVDDDGTCTPTTLYTGEFQASCEYDWGCLKYINYYSTDVDGNAETINSEPLKLIDKGSACQSSCLATPTPNRFLSECRNINNCQYRDLYGDGGATIADRCDLLVEGSYVPYADGKEVLCPNGPLRDSRFTEYELSIEDSICENLLSIPYVGVLEGATVILRVLTCQDE